MESKMSNSDMMMVDPGEIVIDMPVDEQNVLQKMESMKERGIIQPVTLWLQGMRVIDGFHRSVAAQRLGWKEIPCYVVDCSEDAFWDARIQSARQHHKVEQARLNAWILESWKTTEWYKPEAVDPKLVEMSKKTDVFRCVLGRKPLTEDDRIALLSLSENLWAENGSELREWINAKSHMWGLSGEDIAREIRKYVGLHEVADDTRSQIIDKLSREKDLSLAQRAMVSDGTSGARPAIYLSDTAELSEWIDNEIVHSAEGKPSHFNEFRWRKQAEKNRTEIEERQLEYGRKAKYEQTPQGQAEAHNRKVQTVKEAADRAVWALQSIEHLITDSKEFSEPIAEAIASLTAFHNEQFRRRDTQLKDRLATNNAKLRKEVKGLTEEVASLKRALNAKQLATPRLPHVMVEHSQ